MNEIPNKGSQSIPIVGVVLCVGGAFLLITFLAIHHISSSNPAIAAQVTAQPDATTDILQATPTPFTDNNTYEALPPTSTPIDQPSAQPLATAVSPATPETFSQLPPLPPEKRGLILNGDRSQNKIALTFDVCETADNPAGFDQEIINVLNETDTPATFFLGGLWMEHNEAEARELAENPLFELGNHTWSHLNFAAITPEEMASEILLTQQKMQDMFGRQANLFRLPYGTYTEESLQVIADHGMLTIQWDVVSGDPDPNIFAEPMAEWVVAQTQPGSIIIMHANGRGWHTAEALPAIISSLEEQGYIFVTISELLNLENSQSPYSSFTATPSE